MLEAFSPIPKERVSLWFFSSGWSKSKIPQFLDKVVRKGDGWLQLSRDQQRVGQKGLEQVPIRVRTNKY
ncbi:hypothetical protein CH361_00735 [Leptospira brenneri]|nr:hypothetical protein CH361_00735 [Leptospira brenneri]